MDYNDLKSKTIFGSIVGDIVGSRFEFNNYLGTDFELFAKGCAFTDDTICTIAVADALLENIPFDKSLRYWCGKYPTPKGAYGGSFANWLHTPGAAPYHSFGNGSAMRVSPCALLYPNDRETALAKARSSAECTHGHPEGIKGALATADCVWLALNGHSKAQIKQSVMDMYGYDLNMTCAGIRRHNTFNETCQVTVPQAIAAFLESTGFESAIRLAVSIGGDSDTIGAITGSIAHAFYGIPESIETKAMEYLPTEFINVLSNFNKKSMKDYSMYIYYKGSDEYPNRKAAFFGFYEHHFENIYKGKPEDKAEEFKDYICDLLYEQASELYHFPLQIGSKSDCFSEYLKEYFDPDFHLENYGK